MSFDEKLISIMILLIFVIVPITGAEYFSSKSKEEFNNIKQQNKEYIIKISQDKKLAEALKYGCINAPKLFKSNTCETVFELSN